MLTRRHLRVKVMQALYAFFQADSHDINKAEKAMFQSIEKVYDLYLYLLSLFPALVDAETKILEDAKQKFLRTEKDLHPNLKFIQNKLIAQLSAHQELQQSLSSRAISWQYEGEIVRKILAEIKASKIYEDYMHASDNSFVFHSRFIVRIIEEIIASHELLLHFFEEKNIFWIDDLPVVITAVIKTMKYFSKKENKEDASLLPLYKDEKEDEVFTQDLFRKTILHSKEYSNWIATKAKNWEVERIAFMDVLLMKMAITEVLHFPYIPIKVSLNEYIELSKQYSTPQSNTFINGILDKIVDELKKEGKIQKSGRGLIE